MAMSSYWNKSWHTLEGRERNTTSQCFLIAIDLLSCSCWRTSLTLWVSVCVCMCVCTIILVCLHVLNWPACVCVHGNISRCVFVCPCDLLTVLALGTITRAKADTQCYSSLVFHSLHSRSECPALFSLLHLFTSSPSTFPHLSLSLNDPCCVFFAPHVNQTGNAEPGLTVCHDGLSCL